MPDMVTHAKGLMAMLLSLALLLGTAPAARAAAPPGEGQGEGIGRTPPRLSYTNGEVSFWRPGATDWAPAQINTPLAPGDELFTGNQGNLELQVGTRAFVRAWGDTQLGLANQEPDFLQLKVTSGHVSVDLRSVEPARSVEVDTPHGAFVIEHPGYYRVDVTQDRTSFIARRAGRATMTTPGGQAVAISPSEEVVLEGAPTPAVRSYVAPELDTWDRWNYDRTDQLLEAVSARYVASDVYGAADLDHSGSWRVVQTYGSVWVPEAVPAGWVPYSTGRWIWDPYYGWTWIDTAPWGWAPYHYGRWVFVDGFWAWAPGPVVVRPVYAPALVAFFGAPGIRVSIGAPLVSWVALSWGEPLVPWWGPVGFAGRPWWAGWGGPRVVNNVVINRTTVVNVNTITVYRNVGVQNAVVAVPQEHFGRRAIQETRVAQVDARRLEPVRGALPVTPAASSFVGATGPAVRPPDATLRRSVVATRQPASRSVAPRDQVQGAAPPTSAPAPRIVAAPKAAQTEPVPNRPTFGASNMERPRPPQPPRFETTRRPDGVPATRAGERRPEVAPPTPRAQVREPEPTPPGERRGAPEPTRQPPGPARPAPPASSPASPPQRVEPPRPSSRPLPGEPASRLFPGRAETRSEHPAPKPAAAPHSSPGPASPGPAPSREPGRPGQ